jgi:hypothetical protein
MVRLVAGLVGQGLLLGLSFVGLLVLTIVFIATWFSGQYAIALACAALGMGAVALLARVNREGADPPPDPDDVSERRGRRAGQSASFSAGWTTWRGRKGGPGGR